jgi:hypothetical protein
MPVVPQTVAPAASPSASSHAQDPSRSIAARCHRKRLRRKARWGPTASDAGGRGGACAASDEGGRGACAASDERARGGVRGLRDQGQLHGSRANARGNAIQPRAFALDRRTRRGDTPCGAGLGADVRGEEIEPRAFALDRRTRRGDTPCGAGLGADVRGEEIEPRAFALDRRARRGDTPSRGGRRRPRGGRARAGLPPLSPTCGWPAAPGLLDRRVVWRRRVRPREQRHGPPRTSR